MSDSETTTTAASAVDASAPKSEAQAVYDRLLAQCNRLKQLRERLDAVRDQIAPDRRGRPSGEPNQPLKAAPMNAFFDGLKSIADGNDKAIDELASSVDGLAKLFGVKLPGGDST